MISEVGPYYDDGDVSATTPADRLGRFLIENYVPHVMGLPKFRYLEQVTQIIVWTNGYR